MNDDVRTRDEGAFFFFCFFFVLFFFWLDVTKLGELLALHLGITGGCRAGRR